MQKERIAGLLHGEHRSPGKPGTLWGPVAPSRYKQRGGNECCRPGCTEPRHVSRNGRKRRYCRGHTREWSRLKKRRLAWAREGA